MRHSVFLLACTALIWAAAQSVDLQPSRQDGAAKHTIVTFVQATTTQGSPQFIAAGERTATFDHDGTLWVGHPTYAHVMYCLGRAPTVERAKPELAKVDLFKSVTSGNRAAMAKLTGISVDGFRANVKKWPDEARDPHWKKLCTKLTCAPMQGLPSYLSANLVSNESAALPYAARLPCFVVANSPLWSRVSS